MSKFLVTADLHLTNQHSKFKYDKDGVSDLLKAQAEFIDWCADKIEEENYDGFLFLGDWTDYNLMDTITLTYSNRALSRLKKVCDFGLIMEGNHCVLDDKNVFTVLGASNHLAGDDNFHVITEDSQVRHEGVAFHVVPYMPDYNRIREDVQMINRSLDPEHPLYEDMTHVLLFHLPLVNALLDNGVPAPKGVRLDKEDVCNFDICLGGDFHQPQTVHDNLHYVGAPFSLKFGQEHFRGVKELTITKDGCSLKSIPNPFNYEMLTVSPEAFLEMDDLSRKIIRLDSVPDDVAAVEARRDDCYKLFVPRAKKRSVLKEEKDIFTLDVFSESDDSKKLKKLIPEGTDKELTERVLSIFKEIQ